MYLVLDDGDILYSCPPVLEPNLSLEGKDFLMKKARQTGDSAFSIIDYDIETNTK